MPMDLSQVRPEGVVVAVDFARTCGCELDAKAVDPQVSLIATDPQEQIVAAILGVRTVGGACQLHVCLSRVEDAGPLAGELINKSLMKVHGAGIRRCQIRYHGPDETPAHWPGEKWIGQDEAKAEAVAEPETQAQDGAEAA